MLNVKYISSQGVEFDLLTNDRLITECNAFDYAYSPVTFGKRFGAKVYGFEMPMKEFDAEFYVFGENRKEQINELFAAFDLDVANQQAGTLVCNGYSIDVFSIAASDASNNSNDLLWDSFKRRFICPYPFWSKQSFYGLFSTTAVAPVFTDIKDYLPVSENGTADYPYDYMTHYGKNGSFKNEDLVGSEWQLVINGPCVNPEVRIGDLIIKLNVPVGENETITIDSRTKTVILTEENGVTDNVFGYRDVSVDIFTKIPRGVINVWWDDEAESDFSFTLTLFDERTAPLWT